MDRIYLFKVFIIFTSMIIISSSININNHVNGSTKAFLQLPYDHDWRITMSKCFDDSRTTNNNNNEIFNNSAFAVTEILRLKLCIQTYGNVNINFSEDELIKCGNNNENISEINNLFDYIKYSEIKGISKNECYNGKCESDETCGRVYQSNLIKFDADGPIMQEILFTGPVIATFELDENIIKEYNIIVKDNQFIPVILIGYSRSDKEEYWIAQFKSYDEIENKYKINYLNIPFGSINNVYSMEVLLK